ncbi:hypothetical protein DL95DRAFT_459517 [Leptodontidium sp. 2 PMI_412]|nr:hypothetical protein DL95DRAFT_459517 [Leptodontidium sp. 2 PMI_412]
MPEANTGAKAVPTQLSFFQAIFANMKETPEVNWVAVAATAGYNSASTARTRFEQIRGELLKGDGSAGPTSPSKPRVKKESVKSEVGTGTNIAPSKVAKSIPMRGRNKGMGGRAGRGPNSKKVKKEEEEEEMDEKMEKVDGASAEMEI